MKPKQLRELLLQQELAFLYRVAQTVHGLQLPEVLEDIVRIATEVTHADSCLVYILDHKKNELVLRASKNPHPDLLRTITMKVGQGITGWVAQSKAAVAIPAQAHKDSRFKAFRSLPEDRFEAFLSVPIVNKLGVVGVINVQHQQPHTHTAMEVNLLTAMGKLVGGAVENALLVEETMELREILAHRKLVERAKGILMKRRGFSEEDAYRLLQKQSMNSRKTLQEVADAIILSDGLVNDAQVHESVLTNHG